MMIKGLSILAICLSAFAHSPQAAVINLGVGLAAQSSQIGDFAPASNAIDDIVNFTHTSNVDPNPTWQVLLPDSYHFDFVEVFNRGASDGTRSCCPSRLRDITIQIVSFTGDPIVDFSGGTVTYSSILLNPENVLGRGTTDGPISLSADPGGAAGNMIRIIRTIDDDLSGTGGAGNADEGRVLSIDLVTAEGSLVPEPAITLLGLLSLGAVAMRRRCA